MDKFTFRPNNNLTKLTYLSFFSLLYFYSPVMTLFLQEKGLTLWQVNSLWAIILVASFFAEVPTGIIADKIGRKKAIILAIFLQFIGEALFIFFQNYPALILISIIGGIGFAFSSGALEAFLYDDLKAQGKEDQMTWAVGRIGAGARAGNIVSFLIGGILVATLTTSNFRLMIIMTALAVLIGLWFALTLDESSQSLDDETPSHDEEEDPQGILQLGWNQLFSSSVIISLVAFLIFSNPFGDYLLNFYQPYFVDSQVPSVWLGWGPAVGAFCGIFVATNAWRLKDLLGSYRAFLVAVLLPACFLI